MTNGPIERLIMATCLVALGFLLGTLWSRPALVADQDTHTEVVDAGRSLAPGDTAASRRANRLPEREVRYDPVPRDERREVTTTVPSEMTRDSVVYVPVLVPGDSTAVDTVFVAQTVFVPDFYAISKGLEGVDLTYERLRLTLYDPESSRYLQRFYAVPKRQESAWGYRLEALSGVRRELRFAGPAEVKTSLQLGAEGSVRYRRTSLYLRGGVGLPVDDGWDVVPSIEGGLKLRIAAQ